MKGSRTLLLAVAAALCLVAAPALAQDLIAPDSPLLRTGPARVAVGSPTAGTSNSSCAGTPCDTVWVGHKAGTYLGVAVGGVWDFDTDVAGTDSTQGCRRFSYPFTSNAAAAPTNRPEWAYDYGNVINEGNTNLWAARDLAGRAYVKTGVAGAWHADPMTNIRKNANPATNGGEASSAPIDGARSAWCGMRVSGDQTAQDALTGNFINADLWDLVSGGSSNGDWPGYPNLWDQMMYKDFPSAGAGTVSARVRTDLLNFIDNATATGTGWYNPDPTSIAHFVNNPSDSFMVYVGSPNENAYDTNRRWFSEVLDFSKPVQEVYHCGDKMPITGGTDTTLSLSYSGIVPVGGNVRVVFRVKTNRARSDATTGTSGGPNTKDGAAVIDDVQVNGGTVYGFETPGTVTARGLIPDLAADGGAWATTGRPPSVYFHIENLSSLLYEDLCGGVNSTTRRCNMRGNVVVAGDFDNADKITVESNQYWVTPTVDLAVHAAAPGTKNAQGIDQATAARTGILLDYDIYSGFMGLDQSIFWRFGGRYFGPTSVEPVSTNVRIWSPWQILIGLVFQPDPFCVRGANGNAPDAINFLGIPGGQIDSLQAFVVVISQGFRFGGTDLGNTRGTYFDNLRVGLSRTPTPPLSQAIWNKYQDQFPVNENVVPADNGAFDTTTAYVRTGLNIVAPISGPGYVAGDSVLADAPYAGDGVTTGVRMDLVFRISPGPGNYTVKGNRTSALVEKDPAHPFWAAYMADNGAFGTGGNGVSGPGHGTAWNRDVWNSCRMDSAEVNLWPVVSRGIGVPASPTWMGTIHEQDPKFATLGIDHLVCFLSNPAGSVDVTNTDCGTPGVLPPSNGYSAATRTNWGASLIDAVALRKEGTKIIPDGYLTPGSHVEYFLRRSTLEAPNTASLLFDTTRVVPQAPGSNEDFDQERWSSFNVLPDMWKSSRFGGRGLACMLMIDGADRRGADPSYRGAADSLGYGAPTGAAQGWHVVDFSPPNAAQDVGRGPNNPAGFVAANLGQYGLGYDHYDVRASESGEAGHPGARLASIQAPGNSDPRRTDKSGPSPAQLATFYTTVLYEGGDLNINTLDDKATSQEQADDLTLFSTYLDGAAPGNARGLWLAGDGMMEDAFNLSSANYNLFMINRMAADLSKSNYKTANASQQTMLGLLPTAAWAHPGRVYGYDNTCLVLSDLLAMQGTVAGATEGAEYQNFPSAPTWTASIYRPTSPGVREYRTMLDGFQLANIGADYASVADLANPHDGDVGRLGWFDDVVTNFFAICGRQAPIVAVGDLPGANGSRFANANLGAFPNPSFAARAVTLRFSLARAQEVTIRIYTVAGREVARFTRAAAAGRNDIVWDGRAGNGARVAPGVYFYRIAAPGLPADALAPARMVLLSAR